MKHHVHSLNKSSGKQKYSFGKKARFQPYKANTDVSYLPKIDNDRRSALIGYGQRSLLANKNSALFPHAYSVPSTLKVNGGNSMKAGRHEIGGPMQIVRMARSIPGPNYTIPTTLKNSGVSLRPRLPDNSDKYIKSVPGPGAYSIPSSLSNGEHNTFDSKYQYQGSFRIPPAESKSLEIRTPTYQKKQVPGPGQYDVLKYGISNPESVSFKKQGTAKFGKELRQSLGDKNGSKMPGPGAYKIYSQFDD